MQSGSEGDRTEAWRQQLDHALGKPGRSLILADMDHESAVLQVRCQEPRHLMQVARMLLDQARDQWDAMEGQEAEDMLLLCDEALSILPDPDDDDAE